MSESDPVLLRAVGQLEGQMKEISKGLQSVVQSNERTAGALEAKIETVRDELHDRVNRHRADYDKRLKDLDAKAERGSGAAYWIKHVTMIAGISGAVIAVAKFFGWK